MSQFKYRPDLMDHKVKVGKNINRFIQDLYERQLYHDNDKISDDRIFYPYEAHNHDLRSLPFGSEPYRALMMSELQDAAYIHSQNRHHFYARSHEGQYPIDLLDVIEFLSDIEASIRRDESLDRETVIHQLKQSAQKNLANLTLETLIENTINNYFKEDK